jgi:hypothetical protein
MDFHAYANPLARHPFCPRCHDTLVGYEIVANASDITRVTVECPRCGDVNGDTEWTSLRELNDRYDLDPRCQTIKERHDQITLLRNPPLSRRRRSK